MISVAAADDRCISSEYRCVVECQLAIQVSSGVQSCRACQILKHCHHRRSVSGPVIRAICDLDG